MSVGDDAPRGAWRRRSTWAVLAAGAVGAALRLDRIGDQVLADDEWHSLHAVEREGPAWIATHFGASDHGIPLTLWDELGTRTLGLDELWVRAPVLAAGIATVVVLPLLLRRWIGGGAAAALAGLLAIQPLHVYFSRYARPYGPALLAVLAGAACALAWWERGGRRRAAGYVAGAALGPWLHLTVLPAALAPLGLLGLRRARGGGRAWRELALVALAVAAGLALLLGPPLALDRASLAEKSGRGGSVSVETLAGALELVAGTAWPPLQVAFLAAALAGLALLARRAPGAAWMLGGLAAAQVLALLVADPFALEFPMPLVRYALPAVAVLWIGAALAVDEADRWLAGLWRGLGRARGAFAAVSLGALFLLGPLPGIHARPNAFANHNLYQHQYSAAARERYAGGLRRDQPPSPFYDRLAELPPESVTIVEAPWYYEWTRVPFPLLQRHHRQRVLIGFVGRQIDGDAASELPLDDGRFRFRNFVDVRDRAALRERGVLFVVFHKRLKGELPTSFDLKRIQAVVPRVEEYREAEGQPVFEDDDLVVFELR